MTLRQLIFLTIFTCIISPIYAAANISTSAMRVDEQHVQNWNQFAENLYLYHTYLISTHKIRTSEQTGGYADLPDFYREISYYDEDSGRLLSRIQWEIENPQQIHVIETYIYDQNGNLKADYLAAYLPKYRNAPIQTLVNLHYQNDELHSFRQFDASGNRIYEHCTGKFFGEALTISLDEDEFTSPDRQTMKILDSEEYLSCFEHLPHIATPYMSPVKTGKVPASFIAANVKNNTDIDTSDDDIHRKILQLTKFIAKADNKAPLLVERGWAYFQIHDFESSIKDYDQAIVLDNNLDEAYFGRGMAKGRLGFIQQGIADLSVYIERNPQNSRAYTKRGVRYIWAGELAKAHNDLSRAIELDPGNAEAYDDLGVVIASRGNYRKAVTYFQKVVEIDPRYQKGFHNLAMSHHVLGDKQKALQYINSALALNPGDKNSLLLKGEIYSAMGLKKEALVIIERAEFLPDGNWSERFSLPR